MRARRIITALALAIVILSLAWCVHLMREGSEQLAQVHVGMTPAQVEVLLGRPDRTDAYGREVVWQYSSLRFVGVGICFGSNGLVRAIAQK